MSTMILNVSVQILLTFQLQGLLEEVEIVYDDAKSVIEERNNKSKSWT